MCLGEIGIKSKRISKGGNRLRKVPLETKDDAQIGMGFSIVWPQDNRLATCADRLIELPSVFQGTTQIVVGFGEICP